MKKLILAVAGLAAMTVPALADPIEGNWRTESGATAAITPCGGSFCITLKTGDHAGRRIGRVSAGSGGNYSGTITDPADDKTYIGRATISGSTMRMKGCWKVCTPITSKTQTWRKL